MFSQTEPPDRSEVEQRAHARRATPVRCQVLDDRIQRFTCFANLSLGGARVITASPPPVGATVAIRFRLRHDGPTIETQARIIWRVEGFRGRGGLMGVAFVALSREAEVEEYVLQG